MSLDSRGLIDWLTSLAASTGMFDAVNGSEPKSAPGAGVSCSVWISDYRPALSGLSSVSMKLELQARIYTSMLQEPQDSIDPRVLDATDALFAAIVGNFRTSDSNARYVDVFGQDGEGLRATAGYLNQDGKLFRVMDLLVPVVINDVYPEVA